MRFKQARRIIESIGWKLDRVRGSHYIFTKNETELILAQHTKDLPIFMRRKIDKLIKEHEQLQKVVEGEQDTTSFQGPSEEHHDGYQLSQGCEV